MHDGENEVADHQSRHKHRKEASGKNTEGADEDFIEELGEEEYRRSERTSRARQVLCHHQLDKRSRDKGKQQNDSESSSDEAGARKRSSNKPSAISMGVAHPLVTSGLTTC